MKSKVFFIALALLIASVAVRAYAEEETEFRGKCDGTTSNTCFALCPNCSALFEGLTGTGSGTLTKGICPDCSYDFETVID
jgi:hypothetical protein